jgi:hypothetical protein
LGKKDELLKNLKDNELLQLARSVSKEPFDENASREDLLKKVKSFLSIEEIKQEVSQNQSPPPNRVRNRRSKWVGRTYTAGDVKDGCTSRKIDVGVAIGVIVLVLVCGLFLNYATSNTSLIVQLEYKGNPFNGTINVNPYYGHTLSNPVSGTANAVADGIQGPIIASGGNGSIFRFDLHDGFYVVSAFYTNSTGYTFQTGCWIVDLASGNIFFTYHMTIELSNDTARSNDPIWET